MEWLRARRKTIGTLCRAQSAWDHNRFYWWNGHRVRFVNGSWVIFDVGFDPGWWWPCPGYYYGYPCDDGDYDY